MVYRMHQMVYEMHQMIYRMHQMIYEMHQMIYRMHQMVYHDKRNAEEEDSRTVRISKEHPVNSCCITHKQFIVCMRICWRGRDVATPRFPSRNKKRLRG